MLLVDQASRRVATVRSMIRKRLCHSFCPLSPVCAYDVRLARCKNPCILASGKSNPTCPDKLMGRDGRFSCPGSGGDENYRSITELPRDGWLTPNIRLEMPSDVKSIMPCYPHKLSPYLGAKLPPQHASKKSHWNFVEDTLQFDQLELK